MWDEIEDKLRAAEQRQQECDGKHDDIRGEFARWLLEKFAADNGFLQDFFS